MQVQLTATGASNLTWTGNASDVWDTSSAQNWFNGVVATNFVNNDNVTFDNSTASGDVVAGAGIKTIVANDGVRESPHAWTARRDGFRYLRDDASGRRIGTERAGAGDGAAGAAAGWDLRQDADDPGRDPLAIGVELEASAGEVA